MSKSATIQVFLLIFIIASHAYKFDASVKRINSVKYATALDIIKISPDNQYGLWAAVAAASAGGISLEKKTSIGRALSGPVCAMLLSAVATNLGILPAAGSIHLQSMSTFVVKLATPLLLLGADFKRILREMGGLLKAFAVGTIGTLLGAVAAFKMLEERLMMIPNVMGVLSALTAKNIGGGLNFMAVIYAFPGGVDGRTVGIMH